MNEKSVSAHAQNDFLDMYPLIIFAETIEHGNVSILLGNTTKNNNRKNNKRPVIAEIIVASLASLIFDFFIELKVLNPKTKNVNHQQLNHLPYLL
jgi:uncharacterized membrane protein